MNSFVDELDCQIERMAQGGVGLTRWEGRVIFVQGALAGETVRVRVTRRRKDFWEAQAIQILQASPYRVQPQCPYAQECGGCNLQHAQIDEQRRLKKQTIQDTFRRIGKIDLSLTVPQWEMQGGSPWKYRHRVRVHYDAQGHAGFLASQSHHLISISSCPVLCDALQTVFSYRPSSRALQVQWLANGAGESVCWESSRQNQKKPETLSMAVGSYQFQADARVFFQSNPEMMTCLLESVQKQLQLLFPHGGERAIDLYSGVGVFARVLQDVFAQVFAVEWNPGCVRLARRNVKPEVTFVSEDVVQWLPEQNRRAQVDLLVVDPPRSGLDAKVRKVLQQNPPRYLFYVSCHPVTLARDLKDLLSVGYKMIHVEGFDFTPHSDHAEMLVVLAYSESEKE